MIVVDSSVWIDFFRKVQTRAVTELQNLLEEAIVEIIVPDVVLYEVLRGFRGEKDYRNALRLLSSLSVVVSFNPALAIESAQHYRALVGKGFNIRSAIDVMIAGYCISHDFTLLHSDRDFAIMQDLRGLKTYQLGV